ncbi:LSm family protein [Alicyclobacillus sendaiensis]|uniref:LSm family protein n=1 Tax=Alicyclobacillus sendaiensis TaxID=192387 RepID=UPI000B23272B|nr:LSm family protein [Alicyclobacillus sendaiensis]
MADLRAVARNYIGRPVVVHTHNGVHYGILHHVDDRGMYLRVYRPGARVTGFDGESDVRTLDQLPQSLDAETAWWIWPLIFIPWAVAVALALAPWWWGPCWW